MTTDIATGNKLIAKFDEFPYDSPEQFIVTETNCEFPYDRPGTIDDLQYHSSWDWLMPVVEKIESLTNNLKPDGIRLQVCIESRVGSSQEEPDWIQQCYITFNQHAKFRVQGFDKKEVTWKCIILFIKWYNTQNKS